LQISRIRSSSAVSAHSWPTPAANANANGNGNLDNDLKQNGGVVLCASRLPHRAPLPTIIHTPATPTHRMSVASVTFNPTAQRWSLSDSLCSEDSQVRRTLSEILLSASRKPSRPFSPPELSLESIDKSVTTLNCLCSPTNRPQESYRNSSTPSLVNSQLLNPASTSHSSLRHSRKSILCTTKRRRSVSENAADANCSYSSELVQICVEQTSQHSVVQESILDSAMVNSNDVPNDSHEAPNDACNGDRSERVAESLNFLLPKYKLLAYCRVLLERLKFWLVKHHEHSLFVFSETNK
jgi:hypothetical protein